MDVDEHKLHNPHLIALSNVQIKPHSNICANMTMGAFTGFLGAHCTFVQNNIFSSRNNIFMIAFAENGHSITVLEKVTKEYMNITSLKEKVHMDTRMIKKLPWVPKLVVVKLTEKEINTDFTTNLKTV